MAVGARKLARAEAIVTHLASIEELAGIDVLCCDKTGTLTQNRLTVGDPFVVDGATPEEVFDAACLASRSEDGDPIDTAVLAAAGINGRQSAEVLDFVPFDPVHKRTEATVRLGTRTFSVTKGAPQVILALADDGPAVEEEVQKTIRRIASRGYRSLGVARSDDAGLWHFLGVLPLYDPPREDSGQTLATAQQMGVRVKMVTGDQQAIAEEIAGRLELGTHIEDASVLADVVDDETATKVVEGTDGFAQVLPEHKHRIVDLLQRNDHIVGMTGDGVNDAPALKKADVGIAVSGATDAARDASDVVLLKPGLSIIVEAIKETRRIFQRMKSYAVYRIAETIRVLLFMTLSILAFNFYPVTAVMIVLLALLNDGAILSIAYDRAKYGRRPDRWNLPVVLTVATSLGLMGVVASFGLFYLADRVYLLDRQTIQTLIYLKLSVAGHLTIFLTRTEGPFWKSRPSWILTGAVVGTQLIATLIAVYGLLMPALGWHWALVVWGYALAWFVINDFVKQGAYRLASTGLLKPVGVSKGNSR
jgi:H+-transporting ATPase